MIRLKYKWFIIEEVIPPTERKTRCFVVINKVAVVLGEIKWYSPWRQYCFLPGHNTYFVFSKGCLDDVSNFIGRLKRGEI